MTEVADKPTLNFEDKNYVIEDMSDQARVYCSTATRLTDPGVATQSKTGIKLQ